MQKFLTYVQALVLAALFMTGVLLFVSIFYYDDNVEIAVKKIMLMFACECAVAFLFSQWEVGRKTILPAFWAVSLVLALVLPFVL